MNPNAPDHVDELASALIDGLLDDEQAAAARRDPAVVARADEMRAAREVLRAVPEIDPQRRDQAIAAALRQRPSPANLEQVRAQRRARWLAAAAVVVVLALAGALATWSVSSGNDDSEDTAASAVEEDSGTGDEAAEDTTTAAEEADPGGGDAATDEDDGGGEAAAEPETTADAFGGRTDLGSVGSIDELRARARDALDQPSTQRRGEESQDVGCPVPATVERAGGAALRGRAMLAGEPVEVWVFEDAGSLCLLALDASCGAVADQPLGG